MVTCNMCLVQSHVVPVISLGGTVCSADQPGGLDEVGPRRCEILKSIKDKEQDKEDDRGTISLDDHG
jgi:hypothetical protein